MPRSKRRKSFLFFLLVLSAVSAGSFVLRGQQNQTREKSPAKPGSLRAMVENPSIVGDVRVGRDVEIPSYRRLASLADASDVVVRGKVLAARSYPCDEMSFVCTEFRFKVEEVLSGTIPDDRRGKDRIPTFSPGIDPKPQRIGPAADEIVVTQAGGAIVMEGRRVAAYIVDQEMLRVHGEYILFLTWVAENAAIRVGRETYHLTAGPQSAIAVEDGQARSLVSSRLWSHPIRSEIEGPLRKDLGMAISEIKRPRK
jgi:hypothetical protein